MKIALMTFASSLLLFGCHRQNVTVGDSLTGTWLFETNHYDGTKFESSTTVDSNGFYFCHAISHGLSNSIREFDIGGVWEIQNGFMIDTMTNNTRSTNENLHSVTQWQIIRFDDHELIVKYPGVGLVAVFRKVRN